MTPDYGGCIFLNAAAEFADPRDPPTRPPRSTSERCATTGATRPVAPARPTPRQFADRYTALLEGTLIMRHVHNRNDAARFMRPMVESLVRDYLPN